MHIPRISQLHDYKAHLVLDHSGLSQYNSVKSLLIEVDTDVNTLVLAMHNYEKAIMI